MARNKESRTTHKTNSNHQPAAAPLPSDQASPRIPNSHFLITSTKRTVTGSASGHPHEGNGGTITVTTEPRQSSSPSRTQVSPEVVEKIKELVRLSQEQGYLTYNDINDALPDGMAAPDQIEEIIIQLRNLEVEIVDQAEVDRVKQPEPEDEDEKTRLDILDDPVRMYLKQMGQVPLLTRE